MPRRRKGETASELRALADRCRNLAAGLTAPEDRRRLGELASSYEAEAAAAACAEAEPPATDQDAPDTEYSRAAE